MKHPSAHAALLILAILFVPRSADAQTIPGWDCKQFTLEKIDADRVRLMREVECNGDKSNPGQQIFADELIGNLRTGEFEAVGNVLLVSPTARISAERVVYNTRTGFGTFYTAAGSASLGDRVAQDRSMFGTLEPDIYFWGETIEKIGPDRYRIHKGSFTTCVQPTPRWDIGTGNATINLEDYAVLKNAVMRVKDVPVFYLPILYYPIQSDDRATGFLLPTYGSSTFRGQSLSNAFFWAINRSQDLTLLHDWFTETGQGYGGEYRYVLGPGSEGNLRAYRLLQHEVLDGTTVVAPAVTSYELRGALAQLLPYGLRARGQVEYFSSLNTTQLYNTDIYYSSQSQRRFGGSVTGNWGGTTVTANYQRAETFSSQVQSTVGGYAPSLTANLSSKRLGTLPIYVASTGEAAKYLYIFRNNGVEQDLSLGRFDIQPSVRVALSNLPFLNVNASVGFRDTYFTQSNDALNHQVPEGLNRHYWDLRADLVGPTFSRVFTPNNAIADRLKHVIEPTFSVQRITSFDNQARVPQLGGSADFVVGGVTRMTYGLANRVLVRKAAGDPAAAPSASAPRELLNVSMTQSYYTDPFASQYDSSYQSSLTNRTISSFSPIAVIARTQPSTFTTGQLRMEFDRQDLALRTIQASGSSNYRTAQVNVGWSRTNYTTAPSQHTLNASTNLNFAQGKSGGVYAIDWNISGGYILQQRWVGFYNAQCCGLAVEYQRFKYSPVVIAGVPQDHRFNLSFTLAGVGSFSNFFGAFGGGRF